MSQVSLIIYGVAALWAVQSLLNLMQQHRRRTLIRLQRAEIARRERATDAGELMAAVPQDMTRSKPATVKS